MDSFDGGAQKKPRLVRGFLFVGVGFSGLLSRKALARETKNSCHRVHAQCCDFIPLQMLEVVGFVRRCF